MNYKGNFAYILTDGFKFIGLFDGGVSTLKLLTDVKEKGEFVPPGNSANSTHLPRVERFCGRGDHNACTTRRYHFTSHSIRGALEVSFSPYNPPRAIVRIDLAVPLATSHVS